MPDIYGFDHLPNRGFVNVRCIHCPLEGEIWRIPEKARKEHSRGHVIAVSLAENNTGGTDFTINGDGERIQNCRKCGNQFSQERRRGRPALECNSCKGGQ